MFTRSSTLIILATLLIFNVLGCEPEDKTPPIIEIINPTEDLTVFNLDTITIHIEASDDEDLKEIKLFLDSQVIYNSASQPFVHSLSCLGLDGNRILRATAIDGSGNIGESNPRMLRVLKNKHPVARFSYSSDYAVIGQEIVLDASQSSDDEDSLEQLLFRWDWESDETFDNFFSSNPIASQTFIDPGIHSTTLEVKDRYDNTSQSRSSILVKGIYTDKRDEQEYHTIKIGEDTWFAQNLNYATNGQCYNNNEEYCTEYGRLYTWKEAANNCPEGWHLSTDEDWKKLEFELGMPEYLIDSYADRELGEIGKKIKSKTHWQTDKQGKDTIGFAAFPAGIIDSNSSGKSQGIGSVTSYWTSIEHIDSNIEEPLARSLSNSSDGITRKEAGANFMFSRVMRSLSPVLLFMID